jgi:two-component system nitrogen regulation sensor histidine kinase NtrY
MGEQERLRLERLARLERRKRRNESFSIVVLVVIFLALCFVELRLTQLSKILPFVNSVFFFGLVNLNLLILSALCWLIFRNMGKLLLERRRNAMGARLKTRLVLAFLGFSLIPTLVLFTVSALYINTSFDKWFSVKVQNTLQASLEITRSYYRMVADSGVHFASKISEALLQESEGDPQKLTRVDQILAFQRSLLLLDAVEFYATPESSRILIQKQASPQAAHLKDTLVAVVPRLEAKLLERAAQGERFSIVEQMGSGDLIRCLVPVAGHPRDSTEPTDIKKQPLGIVVVSVHIPISLRTKVDAIVSIFDDFQETNPLKVPMKTMYLIILIMVTMVIVFVVVWIGLYLAKQLTDPVARLLEAVQQVGSGNLDLQIDAGGAGSGSGSQDEFGVLVNAFNKMTKDLKENQGSLLKVTDAFEKRSTELETILTSIGTGILVIDSQARVVICNPVAATLLDLGASSTLGQSALELFQNELSALADLIRRAFIMQADSDQSFEAEAVQFSMHTGSGGLVERLLHASIKPLGDQRSLQKREFVLAVDDMTYVAKSQREVAWQEVARRIAHEIKNPLTPIKLSAQRIQRRFSHLAGKKGQEGQDFVVLESCTKMIIEQTDHLKEMVNEFSQFARFPQISLRLEDLNATLDEVAVLFEQAHPDIKWVRMFDSQLKPIGFDKDQIKRVFINLFDNSVNALHEMRQASHAGAAAVLAENFPAWSPQITLTTRFLEALRLVQIEVSDNGFGMSPAVRQRAFEPYFSTRSTGTGLGLAIVKRIVNDHNGVIRLRGTPSMGAVLPLGTSFIIELPAANVVAPAVMSRPVEDAKLDL